MTHTLHEQYTANLVREDIPEWLTDTLNFVRNDNNFYIDGDENAPFIQFIGSGNFSLDVCFSNGTKAFEIVHGQSMSNAYWHISKDNSVRYASFSGGSTMVWAQDVEGNWSFITRNLFVPSDAREGSRNAYTEENVNVQNSKSIYTITSIARSDNGVPFKGLYMVTSARSFFARDALVNIDGDIYRFVALAPANSSSQYVQLAFAVSNE